MSRSDSSIRCTTSSRQIPRCQVAVANPKRVKLVSGSKQKHNKADAKVLGDLLRTNFLKRPYMPDEETREKRFLLLLLLFERGVNCS